MWYEMRGGKLINLDHIQEIYFDKGILFLIHDFNGSEKIYAETFLSEEEGIETFEKLKEQLLGYPYHIVELAI